jgi:3-isopropylmalate/(R)-2-methylmalate dehydratase small subunit
MSRILRGKAWCFRGVMDVDWEICPVEHMQAFREDPSKTYEQRLAELGQYCMTTVAPDFPRKVKPGDIIVGGNGFGYGHDHDHACMSLRGAGVAAVLCEATNANFKRNSIHHGLPVVEVKGIMDNTKTGDELEVDLSGGTVRNLITGKLLTFIPYPEFILEILEAGGIYPQLTAQVKAGVYA